MSGYNAIYRNDTELYSIIKGETISTIYEAWNAGNDMILNLPVSITKHSQQCTVVVGSGTGTIVGNISDILISSANNAQNFELPTPIVDITIPIIITVNAVNEVAILKFKSAFGNFINIKRLNGSVWNNGSTVAIQGFTFSYNF